MPTETVNRRHNRHPAQSLHALQIAEALLKIQTVIAVTGRSESTIRRKVADGKFPQPVKDVGSSPSSLTSQPNTETVEVDL
jgi:prophage regulatory protein